MPIYRYECKDCKYSEEISQSLKEGEKYLKELATADTCPSGIHCPACDAPSWRRVLSATTFSLTGAGWFKDGY